MKKETMIKIVMAILVVAGIGMWIGRQGPGEEPEERFYGEWECQDSPLEMPDIYVGYLHMTIDNFGNDTEISIYDIEAGNPSISGYLTRDSDTELTIYCKEDEELSPPPPWEGMESVQKFTYKFLSDNTLHITYKDGKSSATLVFVKEEN